MVTKASKIEFVLNSLDDAERITTARLSITLDGDVVWPVLNELRLALEVQIDDLLAYLTEFWKPLMLRQVYPIPVTPLRPSDLRRLAEQRWANLQSSAVEREDILVTAFEEAHDLATAFGGQFGLPHFWMMRSAQQVVIEAAGREWRIPFNEVRASLERVGNEICRRLAKADGGQWDTAIEAWEQRDTSDQVALLAWSAGIELKVARTLIDHGNLAAPRDFDDAANDNDELRIAARMAGALPAEQIQEILTIARGFKWHAADKLHALAKDCAAFISEKFARKPPFTQGEAAAIFARNWLGVPNDGMADIFALMTDLCVEVQSLSVKPDTFDGLAISGGRFGPGVFLNEASSKIKEPVLGNLARLAASRVTLSHELCHLLLDGGHALSAVEVMNARMPAGVEARAKSFAGEFLLPTLTAARAWVRAERPTDRSRLEKLVATLADTHGVTWSVAAWKIQHGAQSENADLERVLNTIAPYR